MTDEEQTLAEIRDVVAQLSKDDQIRVTCIATTLRNVLDVGGEHAAMALALVGAELAAKP